MTPDDLKMMSIDEFWGLGFLRRHGAKLPPGRIVKHLPARHATVLSGPHFFGSMPERAQIVSKQAIFALSKLLAKLAVKKLARSPDAN